MQVLDASCREISMYNTRLSSGKISKMFIVQNSGTKCISRLFICDLFVATDSCIFVLYYYL